MNKCVKTGCFIATIDAPANMYRGDAFYFKGILIFRVRNAHYMPDTVPDFIVDDASAFFVEGMIIDSIDSITLKSKEIERQWNQYCPNLLKEINVSF